MFLLNFVLTFAIELLVFYLFLRKNYFKTAISVLLINLFTWPLANLTYGFWNHLIAIEFGVFLLEGILIMMLFNLHWKKAFLISLIANFISAFSGLFLDNGIHQIFCDNCVFEVLFGFF
jgi:hypothetical protein